MRARPRVGLHWFDPFGSVNFSDICNVPPVDGQADLRLVFWDQEPVYQDTAKTFFDQYCSIYRGSTKIICSELQSQDLKTICNTYRLSSDYYFFHGWAALDWYRGYNHSYLSVPWSQREFTYSFICPNNIIGGRRTHRLALFAELVKRNLSDQNLVSFPNVCPHEMISAQDLARQHGIDLPACQLPLIIDRHHNHASDSHKIDFWDQGTQAFVHVVTETVYTSDRLHLTEKTFKPIVMQQPFILLAPKHSLRYLRSYGFQTFGEFWDETYDDLSDDQRVGAVADLIGNVASWSEPHRREMQRELSQVIQHNHDWFYGGFQDLLWNEIREMINRW